MARVALEALKGERTIADLATWFVCHSMTHHLTFIQLEPVSFVYFRRLALEEQPVACV